MLFNKEERDCNLRPFVKLIAPKNLIKFVDIQVINNVEDIEEILNSNCYGFEIDYGKIIPIGVDGKLVKDTDMTLKLMFKECKNFLISHIFRAWRKLICFDKNYICNKSSFPKINSDVLEDKLESIYGISWLSIDELIKNEPQFHALAYDIFPIEMDNLICGDDRYYRGFSDMEVIFRLNHLCMEPWVKGECEKIKKEGV